MKAAKPFFLALYGQQLDISTESARFTLFTKKKVRVKVMALPPTSENLLLHVLRAHLQVMLWKAVNLPAPPDESADITHFGWEIRDDIPVPVIAQGDPAPPELNFAASVGHMVENAALRHVDATKSMCHVQHTATVLVKRNVAIHILSGLEMMKVLRRRILGKLLNSV